MLAAAVELASFPKLPDAHLHAEVHSAICGSTLTIDIETDPDHRINTIGMQVRACAVGQAAAAAFARHAKGRSIDEIHATLGSLNDWLNDDGPLPDWPDMALIAPARDFRGRHGAIVLPWKAAIEALSTLVATR